MGRPTRAKRAACYNRKVGASLTTRRAEGASVEHARLTGIVVDDVDLVYVPVPKAATTSILSALAELVGVDPVRRLRSGKLEATRSTTVHDGSLWPPAARLGRRSDSEQKAILASGDWFRFTVVREPVRRIWSAWVTKVLVRDPRFLVSFGEDLFPPSPRSVEDVLKSFRAFVCALPDRPDFVDSHWASQAELVGIDHLTYDFVGRVERLDEVVSKLDDHLQHHGRRFGPLEHGNASFLPFSPGLFDRDAYETCVRWTARDRDVFGYDLPSYADGGPDPTWYATVESALPSVRAIIDRHERFLDIWRLLEGAERSRHGRPRRVASRVRAKTPRVPARALALASLFAMAYWLPSSVHHL